MLAPITHLDAQSSRVGIQIGMAGRTLVMSLEESLSRTLRIIELGG